MDSRNLTIEAFAHENVELLVAFDEATEREAFFKTAFCWALTKVAQVAHELKQEKEKSARAEDELRRYRAWVLTCESPIPPHLPKTRRHTTCRPSPGAVDHRASSEDRR